MADMSLNKYPTREQAPDIRNKNFKEVSLGYDEETAIREAGRCLACKNMPCVGGCPVNVHIPEFITKIKELDFEGAYKAITDTNSLPAVCGRVCPQESQCESKCVRGIKGEPVGIGRLERFIADWHREHASNDETKVESNGIKVAVIGSGPAGLSCAGDLCKKGYDVTVFEALHSPGGVLSYGIPEFRLPKAIVGSEIEHLKKLGVDIQTNIIIGKTFSIDELFDRGYKAVFIGSGAGLPVFMGIPGESLNTVYSANEYLTRINLMKSYKKDSNTPIYKSKNVAVVGGGNVAMDAARCAKRLGAENVYIIYRRSEAEMPARLEEVHHAKEEGIIFRLLTNPTEILGDEKGNVTAIKCLKMELSEPDESGRRRPVAIEGSEYEIPVDTVVMSIGTSPNPLIKNTTEGLETNKRGCIFTVDETGLTTKEGVYAGGDAVTGAATVILAMGAGKVAAEGIDKFIKDGAAN